MKIINQAVAFCKENKCSFKIRYELCVNEFTAHIRKMVDEETGKVIENEDGVINLVVEHQEEISMARGKTMGQALQKALGSAREKA